MTNKQIEKIAQRLIDGDLAMFSDEYNNLDPVIRDAACAIYQNQSEASEKERMRWSAVKAQEENEAVRADETAAQAQEAEEAQIPEPTLEAEVDPIEAASQAWLEENASPPASVEEEG
jgi:hypothetical protein